MSAVRKAEEIVIKWLSEGEPVGLSGKVTMGDLVEAIALALGDAYAAGQNASPLQSELKRFNDMARAHAEHILKEQPTCPFCAMLVQSRSLR